MEIKLAQNGVILVDNEGDTYVFQEVDEHSSQYWIEFLWFLTETFGPTSGKYDDERVYINVAPGYKSDKWDGFVCPLCLNTNKDEDV